jgi:hypothetical protein
MAGSQQGLPNGGSKLRRPRNDSGSRRAVLGAGKLPSEEIAVEGAVSGIAASGVGARSADIPITGQSASRQPDFDG